jgi:restriction endonuclease S subunit
VPPIEEQRAIAEVLGALDDRIEWCDSIARP